MGIPVESRTEPSGAAALPDYQHRLVPLLGGAAAALVLGWLIAPQIDKVLHPNDLAIGQVQHRLAQAIRQDAELRSVLANLTFQFAGQRHQCGQPPPRTAGEEMRLPPPLMSSRAVFDYLAGCWASTAGIKNARSGDDLSIEICFDSSTAVRVAVIEPDKNACQAKELATQVGPRELRVSTQAPLQCGDGKTYVAPTISCRAGPDDIANCQAETGSAASVATRFVRK